MNTSECHREIKSIFVTEVQPLFRAVQPFCRNCSNWCSIDKWVIPPSLFFLLFLPPWHQSALRKQDIRKMSSGSLLQHLVCLQAVVSSSDQPLFSSPEVAVFRHDLPPLHSSLCLWNVQRSAPHCLHKETCFGDSCLASAHLVSLSSPIMLPNWRGYQEFRWCPPPWHGLIISLFVGEWQLCTAHGKVALTD